MNVSIIIPAFNSEKFIRETVLSVLSQTMTDWELVIVDDGSVDATPQIVHECERADNRIRSVRQANGGIAQARNAGYRASNPGSAFVMFLDHDDVLARDALDVLIGRLNGNPSAVGSHGLARHIDLHGNACQDGVAEDRSRQRLAVQDGRIVLWPLAFPTTYEVLVVQNYIMTPGCVLLRRCTVDQVGLFDPKTVPCDDWDLYLRLSRRGPFEFVDRVLLGWRRHEGRVSNSVLRMHRAFERTRRKIMRAPENTKAQKKAARIGACRFYGEWLSVSRNEVAGSLRAGRLWRAVTRTPELIHYWGWYTAVRLLARSQEDPGT